MYDLQELQAHYDEGQRQLAVTLDQLAIAQRKIQSLTGEMEELRGNYDAVCTRYSVYYPFSRDFYSKRDVCVFIRHYVTNELSNKCTKNRRAA